MEFTGSVEIFRLVSALYSLVSMRQLFAVPKEGAVRVQN